MRETILACTRTNLEYMRTTGDVGKLPGFGRVAGIYDRLAVESVACAEAWVAHQFPCPPHSPAVDALWWGIAAWAPKFTDDALAPAGEAAQVEAKMKFSAAHRVFAFYLRPLDVQEEKRTLEGYNTPAPGLSAVETILHHDAAWTSLVIRLTARWGLLQHLKDLPALWESFWLMRRLRRWPDPAAFAYAESDLLFFDSLFGHFTFSPSVRSALAGFQGAAKAQLDDVRPSLDKSR